MNIEVLFVVKEPYWGKCNVKCSDIVLCIFDIIYNKINSFASILGIFNCFSQIGVPLYNFYLLYTTPSRDIGFRNNIFPACRYFKRRY